MYMNYNNRVLDSNNDNKEPKRRQTCVVWAIGEYFFFNFFVFLYTNNCFII